MSFEMICGQCRGNLLVEQFGVVVACPHCGAHLHVPAPAGAAPAASPPAPVPIQEPPAPIQEVTLPAPPPEPPQPIAEATPLVPIPVDAAPVTEPAPTTDEMRVFTGDESEPPPSVEISIAPSVSMSDATVAVVEHVIEEAAATTTTEERFSLSALMSSSEAAAPAAAVPESSTVPETPTVPETFTEPPTADFESPTEPAAATSESSAPLTVTEPTPEPVAETPAETVPTGLSGLFGSSVAVPPPEASAIAEEPPAVETAADAAPAEPPSESEPSPHEDHSEPLTADSAALSPPPVTKPAGKDHVTVSKSAFLLLLSYSSAITIGFLYLLYYGSASSKDYGLESLPDVVPAKKKTAGISVYKESATMPDGHDLKVGDQQRFGNIEVTVLKVTRGSVHFRHFSDAGKVRLPSAPVLKLWLRFKNVSEDQEIAPLDDQLLFTRAGKTRFEYRSNQFVCRADDKLNREALRVIAYDHKIGSGWDLADLPLEKPLQPGESRDYYVPTCENDLDKLTGDLLWRVHIRKGYSARGNGVTTLFEVHFHSDAIRDEQA